MLMVEACQKCVVQLAPSIYQKKKSKYWYKHLSPKYSAYRKAIRLLNLRLNINKYSRFSRHPNRNSLVTECPAVQIENRIVGGEEAPIGRYPWLALLGYGRTRNEGNLTWECGGVLIGDQFVLTAAHCIDDDL